MSEDEAIFVLVMMEVNCLVPVRCMLLRWEEKGFLEKETPDILW